MIKTRTAGGVVLNREGKVLVVSQRGTSWSLPKGHVEEGEDLQAAAMREIAEESGVTDLEYVDELGTYERYKIGKDGGDDKSELKTITMFLFRTSQTELSPNDTENPEARWVTIAEVVPLLTHYQDQDFFEAVRARVTQLARV